MKKLIIPVLLIILCPIPTSVQSQTLSLWGDELQTTCHAIVDQYEPYTVYVFLEPGPDGAFAVEYKVVLPDSNIMILAEPNSFVSGAVIGLPAGPPGISVPFTSCQGSMVWVYKLTLMMLAERGRGFILLSENDDSGFMGVAICPDPRPMLDVIAYNYFGVNLDCAITPCFPPWLVSAEAILRDKVAAYFDFNIKTYPYPPEEYDFGEAFTVCSTEDPPDSINILSGQWIGSGTDSCLLTLERSMLGGVQYKLIAEVCGGNDCRTCCATTDRKFTCPVIATQLQQFSTALSQGSVTLNWQLSSIDPGTIFHVSRRELDGSFAGIGEMTGTVNDLTYSFDDRAISGGKTYIYRVEYISDSDRGILFETDAVETAPVPLILAQNHPNPFNPSTTIEFYLPESGQVTLRVFDVSGRLVRTLVDDAREPGSHSVTWNGLDEHGNQVPSGVYFSRLRTGKSALSKKMILLR